MNLRFRPSRSLARRAAAILSLGLATLPAALIGAAPAQAGEPGLFVKYATTSVCTVYLNYPADGVRGNGSPWTVPAGKNIIWRYNVDRTWAMVSYPARAHEAFPWWGFTRRDCIGKSVRQKGYPAGRPIPDRILQGRSQVFASGWRPVEFNVAPAPVTAHRQRVAHNATRRDPANFVIGNVPESWHVDVTDNSRSKGHWIEVYVPNAKRWGYIERRKLG